MAVKENSEKGRCYKLREQPGQALLLDVRQANGDRYAFPYSYMIWAKYERSVGLYIRFSSHTVLLNGRTLKPIYDGILQQRVEFVQEEHPGHDAGSEAEPFINAITVSEAEEGNSGQA